MIEYGQPRRYKAQRLDLPILLILISSTVCQIGAASSVNYNVSVIDDASGEPIRGTDINVIRRVTRIRDLYWKTLTLRETNENGSTP